MECQYCKESKLYKCCSCEEPLCLIHVYISEYNDKVEFKCEGCYNLYDLEIINDRQNLIKDEEIFEINL